MEMGRQSGEGEATPAAGGWRSDAPHGAGERRGEEERKERTWDTREGKAQSLLIKLAIVL